MNRTDRLLAIVLELQARGQTRADDLAAVFETSVRTIYRDMQALSEAGVPIVAVPGQGYSLMEGYFLPPLRFSTEEAIMLLLGGDFVAQNFDQRYRTAALSAGRKIEAVLPEPLRQEVRDLQQSIRFITADALDDPIEMEKLQQLRRAIIGRRRVRFKYHARFTEGTRQAGRSREVDPYGLAHFNRAWYLVAHDHLRKDLRRFRLDRIEQLSLAEKRFERPAGFSLRPENREEHRNLTIRALFDQAVARWVRESRYYFVAQQADTPEGLLVTLQVRDASEALDWLLSWGAHVQVLEPESLRQRLAQEARAILQVYAGPS